mgnify:CR=1 FL=1
MNIHESAEDYLEKMLMLREKKGYIKSIDIARELGVTKPSVSYAVKNLREDGYITMDKGGEIHLLEKGEKIAANILGRHRLLCSVLEAIGVSEENAHTDACKIEHDLSDETIDAIRKIAEEHNIEIKPCLDD